MTQADWIVIAKADVFLYARRVTLGTATVDELLAAFKRYDEVRGLPPLRNQAGEE